MRRLTTLLSVIFLAAAMGPAAEAGAEGPPNPVRRVKVTRDIVFPIVGATRSVNGFGSCRDNCTREHHGVDILTYQWKGLPVVASHDGVVTEIRDDGEWCNVEITGDDGWHTRYVHLNNDSPGYDDEDFICIAPGIALGERVAAGRLIGWVGDSGNAEHTQPHIHFEIRMPSGLPVDPLRSLKAARRIRLRQVGEDSPSATAARIGLYAYPEGAPAVTVMAIDDYMTMLDGGFVPLQLDGPLLLSEWDHIPAETSEALAALDPVRVDVFGDLWLQEVLDDLAGRSQLIEQKLERVARADIELQLSMIEPGQAVDEQTPNPDDGVPSLFDEPRLDPAPYSIVLLGDRYEMDGQSAIIFGALTERVPTTIMDFADPDGRIGEAAFEGIGRSGSRYTLYYPTGDEWTRYRAREGPPETPRYGVFVVEPGDLTVETLAFLDSITEAPVMPLWR